MYYTVKRTGCEEARHIYDARSHREAGYKVNAKPGDLISVDGEGQVVRFKVTKNGRLRQQAVYRYRTTGAGSSPAPFSF